MEQMTSVGHSIHDDVREEENKTNEYEKISSTKRKHTRGTEHMNVEGMFEIRLLAKKRDNVQQRL